MPADFYDKANKKIMEAMMCGTTWGEPLHPAWGSYVEWVKGQHTQTTLLPWTWNLWKTAWDMAKNTEVSHPGYQKQEQLDTVHGS